VTALLQMAGGREARRLSVETSSFQEEYTKARQEVQTWYEKASKAKGLAAKQREDLQREYQSKIQKLDQEWQPRQEEFGKRLETMRKETDARQAELATKRCEVYRAIAKVYRDRKEPQQATYYDTLAYQESARMKEQTSDYEGAEAEYGKWLKEHPEDTGARLGLARVFEQQQKLDGAAAQYRELLRKSPEDTNVRSQLANLLARQKKWDEATKQWLSLVETDRKSLAEVVGTDGLAQNRRTIIKSQMATHYWELADTYREAGKKAEAKRTYAKAVECNPQLKGSVPQGFGE